VAESNARVLRLLAGAGLAFVVLSAVIAAQAPIECHEPKACAELALEARASGAYEVFHDLAWRAVQTGRPNDPELMYLLARAQALSGRRRDALVMLRRLAESGIVTDAATEQDLRRVRELPEWPYIASLSTRARSIATERASAAAVAKPGNPAAPPAVLDRPPASAANAAAPAVATPPVSAAPGAPAARRALRVERASAEEAARFSTRPFVPGGLAYDAVSRRLLFGDVTGRRLFVVGEGSDRTTDLVRADSAGFDDVTAIAVDAKRGELWVASSATSGSGGAVHRLQLISGRALARFSVPGEGPMRLRDVAVTGDGTILILDGATPRVFVRRPGATTVALLMPLTAPSPVSITVSDDGRTAYVAHRDGITHIDVSARRARPLGGATDITLAGFEFIRWYRDVLIGSQVQPDGSRGLVRLRLTRDHLAASQAALIDDPGSADGSATFATISDDDLYYVVAEAPGNQTVGSALVDVRVKRVRLR
jgi:DNA-binding beta-propeller fold protein YncE